MSINQETLLATLNTAITRLQDHAETLHNLKISGSNVSSEDLFNLSTEVFDILFEIEPVYYGAVKANKQEGN
jgi:hypothetical protein